METLGDFCDNITEMTLLNYLGVAWTGWVVRTKRHKNA
jgi:hypothetical protein